jgi:hypothetical protein
LNNRQGGETQQEQINRLLERIHSRVNQAAVAAESVLKVDGYRREAQHLAAASQIREARAELERATQVITAADQSVIQEDFLLQDYAWKVQYALNTLGGNSEASARARIVAGSRRTRQPPVVIPEHRNLTSESHACRFEITLHAESLDLSKRPPIRRVHVMNKVK